MYKGRRDPMVGIAVPQAWCESFISKGDNRLWISIHIPPETAIPGGDYNKWPSLAIPPEQVFYLDDVWNEFQINAGAEIMLAYKDRRPDNTTTIVDQETASTEQIQARILNFFLKFDPGWAAKLSHTAGKPWPMERILNCYHQSGRTMLGCVKQFLPAGYKF